MHEISIMEQTVAIAIDNAQQEKATKINKIIMRIGKLSGVVPSALEFAFEVVTKNTIAENASLEIESIPVSCWCKNCQVSFNPPEWFFECPNCHQLSHHILAGKEIELAEVEIERQ